MPKPITTSRDDDLEFNMVPKDSEEGESSAGHPGEDEYARMQTSEDKDSRVENDPADDADVYEIEAWLIKKEKAYSVMTVNPQTSAVEKFDFDTSKEAKAAEGRIGERVRPGRPLTKRKLPKSESSGSLSARNSSPKKPILTVWIPTAIRLFRSC
jgi:hypothetical protein